MSRRGAPLGRPTGIPDAHKIRLYAAVGAAIRERRKAAGMTVPALSGAMGISTSTLCNYEEGVTPPTLVSLYAAAMALDCTLDDLVPVIADGVAA